ncbi:glycosyltransferase family 2 protein [Yoonia sediminilitoris]|uniref:Glycosyl transferase family 2 n=1 Tax=Yoonia sediminilitoris TaxID=1286148 RepID=A0A2T6KLN3_9RHOB|nr:glycosyltransferase family 2 protein [Yoonia sediminilitoris]PUB17116.1 glycosyl transferase family 2 [Yoonia sediminilitoris]RCW97411.1 glycosyl transferase family 2 [Yoonia sediminilitoris]
MNIAQSYLLRLQRKRWKIRAFRKRRELRSVQDRTGAIRPGNILLFATFRNEDIRLPYFFDYYRKLGVDHFLLVDNDSSDGGGDYAANQPDVSLWSTDAGYGNARFGIDWLTYLQSRYADGHWALTVDVDEFFVYPFCDTRPLAALGDWLDASEVRSFGTIMLDMYPKERVSTAVYERGTDPFAMANWFDAGNHMISRNKRLRNLWIQGGPRARAFFADRPAKAPALNKIPFVKWSKRYTYVSSTHMILPRGLNLVYDQQGGEKTSGVLLHAKFINIFGDRAAQEAARAEHYQKGNEYRRYTQDDPILWSEWSHQYVNWRQLEGLGLMSKGNWA